MQILKNEFSGNNSENISSNFYCYQTFFEKQTNNKKLQITNYQLTYTTQLPLYVTKQRNKK